MRPPKPHITAGSVVIAAVACLVACASSVTEQQFEPASVARRLRVSPCKVSVPMSQEEVILSARRSGDPTAENGADWAKIVASARQGDELRMVDCVRYGGRSGYYYYALFRGDSVVASMPGVIIN
jgi:hypothetical protein